MYKLVREILKELKEIKKLLQVNVSNKEEIISYKIDSTDLNIDGNLVFKSNRYL